MRILLVLLALVLANEASARTRVTVYKAPVARSYDVPLMAVPVVLAVIDLSLRTSCDPKVIEYGRGPGFDPKEPIVGNFLLPAIYTRCGYPVPKWLQAAMPKR